MSGLRPGRHLAEDLEQAVLAERDRGVALLAAEERRVRLGVEVVAADPVERQPAVLAGRVDRGRREGVEVDSHRLPVVHGVVGVRETEVVVGVRADVGVTDPLLLLGVVRKRHLVALLDPASGIADGEDVDGHGRRTGQRRDALDVDHVVVPALAGEPPGTGKVLRHLRVLAHVGVPAALGAKRATSWGDLIGGTPSRRCRGRAAGSSRSRTPRA